MGTTKFGIVVMMVVVGASPNTAWAQDQDPKNPHQPFGQLGMRQNSLVLVIVVDDKKAKIQQPGQETTDQPASQVEIPKSSRLRAG